MGHLFIHILYFILNNDWWVGIDLLPNVKCSNMGQVDQQIKINIISIYFIGSQNDKTQMQSRIFIFSPTCLSRNLLKSNYLVPNPVCGGPYLSSTLWLLFFFFLFGMLTNHQSLHIINNLLVYVYVINIYMVDLTNFYIINAYLWSLLL